MEKFIAAIDWYDKGISCIPCYPDSKRLLKGVRVKDYYHELTDFSQLIEWFADDHCNIALVTRNGLCVLDFDSIVDYANWLDRYQLDTYTVATKRGYHVYFWIAEPVISCECKYAEIKCNGAHVMIPPSKIGDFKYYVPEDAEIAWVMNINEVCDTQSKEKGGMAINTSPPSFPTLHNSSLITCIKTSLSILAYLNTQKPIQSSDNGRFYMAHCPAHEDGDRSLSIDVRNGLCSCFKPSCALHSKRGYDVVGLHAILNGLSNGQAARDLMEVNINGRNRITSKRFI